MESNRLKAALTKSLKAEEKKVIAGEPAAASRTATLPASRAKLAAKLVPTKRAQKTSTSKNAEKSHAKLKVIRDSFTMPESEYESLADLREKCLAAGLAVKKSDMLRAGLMSLSAMSQAELIKQISKLSENKVGRKG